MVNSGRKQMCGNLKSVFNALKTFVNDTAQDQIGFAQITAIKYVRLQLTYKFKNLLILFLS